ncbi:MAG TPA: CRISPR-associated endonuclease Cas1 [Candidatus Cloacimonadota bacterium]|jgi:CRISPR-associated protein Cas1|nr:CRISPR-associated endonuclease Cas1 [Candidatus Cloacimonadota bacterium]HOG30703.1 CRISPR-associated endonuclease Cas1 [Candidatus Cloacimonadota bacterium]HPB09507.1 CRISPR-associated endonuclease Cas1 [Candidatus Cloacimonadota bacterium]HPL23021.1 CRISPR-associated endonuclease Cas1 [Candidatus Cloacimonadota bacterium]HQO44771.1 CRISPR-associated endonuclease Cas1 [Candidatus Cloacimonadota bacterium]
MELHLNTFGTFLRKKDDMFEVMVEGKKTPIAPAKVSSIIISNAATMTTDAIQLALEHNIDVVFLDKYGSPYARIWFPKIGSTVLIRRRQLEALTNETGLEFIKLWITLKIMYQCRFMKALISKRDYVGEEYREKTGKMQDYALKVFSAQGTLEDLGASFMGWEGSASKLYFSTLGDLIPEGFRFKGRSSHPAKDAFNVCLNYGYGILYSKVERALVIAGLDPYIGLLHTDNYNKKSFVFDFIEPYRHFIDEPVFHIFSRHRFKPEYVEEVHQGVILSTQGKKFLAPLLLEHLDTRVRYHNKNRRLVECIQTDAHAFANFLINRRGGYLDKSLHTKLENFLGSGDDDSGQEEED